VSKEPEKNLPWDSIGFLDVQSRRRPQNLPQQVGPVGFQNFSNDGGEEILWTHRTTVVPNN
jgi:hypothetical protein